MDHEFHQFSCPHCQGTILVHHHELNCRIFRHGVDRMTMQPMNPHASKQECERLLSEQRIIGCAGPFQVIEKDGALIAVICDYI
jgi:hypothetical protein